MHRPPGPISLEDPLKVIVKADGRIFVDGAEVSLNLLIRFVKNLQPDGRLVYYYREHCHLAPTPQAWHVFESILPHAPGIALFDDPEFTVQSGLQPDIHLGPGG